MRRPLSRLALVAVLFGSGGAALAAEGTKKPATQWMASAAQTARAARVEAGLAPIVIEGEKPQSLTLPQWMALYRIPGLSIAVFDKHAIVWARSYGVKEAGGSEPVTLETLFQAGSISKPVTAMAALHFVEAGKWSLDENINDRLRSWKLPENDFTKEQKVTLRRLLSHSAGTTVHGFPGYAVGAPVPTLVQVLEGVKPANTSPVRVDLIPGTKTRYSGGGTSIVQLMMVDQLQKPFPQIMSEAVLKPLGMTQSSYEQPLPPDRAARTATGTYSGGKSVAGRWHVYPEMAAAGLWTTPSDLARVALEVSKAKAGKSTRVLSQAMTQQMLTKQSETFGLGFQVGPGTNEFRHGGSDEGFQAALTSFSDTGSGVVVMANSDNGFLLFDRLIASVASEYGWTAFKPEPESPSTQVDVLMRLKGVDTALAWYTAKHAAGMKGLESGHLNQLGYRLLGDGKGSDAVRVFETNVKLFPTDANAYDSLGEAQLQQGRKEEAIASYKKSLALDAGNANAVKVLEKLGVPTGK
ncbi:serine hydrolase [Corallococcus sp. CA047B]|uniref:serine hydrolase domain-containing protein n=1 Tax=Corallococcus sp. CA047B TaxID=2316729 RepID=UPI000EA3D52D|nr:serine hydrolase domain-containing protein [Corallococcus sp. CA047B]RKH20554.1 serine hydrolase [Corallococcus sp. CA047B]